MLQADGASEGYSERSVAEGCDEDCARHSSCLKCPFLFKVSQMFLDEREVMLSYVE